MSKKLINEYYKEYCKIIYTDKFIFKNYAAQVFMIPFVKSIVLIRPSYKGVERLLDHELTHVKQRKNDLFYIPKYFLFKNFRLNAEAEAYAVQLSHLPVKDRERYLNIYSNYLFKNYLLNTWFYKTTLSECSDRIKDYFKKMRFKL